MLSRRWINFSHCVSKKLNIVMGIETSCDDTGCGIVNSDHTILGESLDSQSSLHLRHGGIIPPIAQQMHRKNIESVVNRAINQADIKWKHIDAIAVTVEPGLPLSLIIGLKYAKYLHKKHQIPLIPVHHMEAHALVARMKNDIRFPLLTLLISGGNCLLALVNDVDQFILIGETTDGGPGEALDKVARRLKIRNIEEFSTIPGGRAIEIAAQRANDPELFNFPPILTKYRNCNFSFSGLKTTAYDHIIKQEHEQKVGPDDVIPDLYNLCAGFQFAVAKHLCQRTQRAMEFIERSNLIPDNNKTLIVSGGVARNDYIYKALGIVCDSMGYSSVRPQPELCTDNGVMIAWNGMEKLLKNIDIYNDASGIDISSTKPFSRSMVNEVSQMNIKCEWIKLTHRQMQT